MVYVGEYSVLGPMEFMHCVMLWFFFMVIDSGVNHIQWSHGSRVIFSFNL